MATDEGFRQAIVGSSQAIIFADPLDSKREVNGEKNNDYFDVCVKTPSQFDPGGFCL